MIYIHTYLYIRIYLFTRMIYTYFNTETYYTYKYIAWKRNTDGKNNDWNDAHYAFFLGKCDGREFVIKNSTHGPNWPCFLWCWYIWILVKDICDLYYLFRCLLVKKLAFLFDVLKVVRLNSKVNRCLHLKASSVQRLQSKVSIFLLQVTLIIRCHFKSTFSSSNI